MKHDTPSFLIGRLIAAPSGKFCIAIPNAKETADIKLFPYRIEPKATPIASPSGILCNVIEVNNKIHFLRLRLFS